jgi:hypothetical protein
VYPRSTKGYKTTFIYTEKVNPSYMSTISNSLPAKDDG